MNQIPQNFYRTSIKALVLNGEKKFLLAKESDGRWELPGGGMDHGETPQTCLEREIKEEMGLSVTWVSNTPSYFYTLKHKEYRWVSNILFETKLKNLNFTPSDECTELDFFSAEEAKRLICLPNIDIFLTLFNPKNHSQN